MDPYLREELVHFVLINKKFKDYRISQKDREILKQLAEKKAEIASLPSHKKTIKMWKDLNSLKQSRPMVWINEIPWNEMDVNDELSLKTSTEFSRYLEERLLKTIYLWDHMRADMVVEPVMPCYFIIEDTGFGISEEVKVVTTDETSDIISREFKPQILDEIDINKIKTPKVFFNKKDTELKFEVMSDIFDGILKVGKRGIPGFWFSPWDELIRWWGVQKAMEELITKSTLVHQTMNRLTDAYLGRLDQVEDQNLLSLNNGNYRTGSGGLSYTDELPGVNFNPDKIKASDLWGCGTAQIFSAVSPQMHQEFALDYEIKWMKRFGLNYYGCCEPLDKKIDILKNIPNLRKISMSPWVDLVSSAEAIGPDYVFSYKPSPSIFVESDWNIDMVKKNLIIDLEKIKNCNVELIMKDVSTLKYKPQRLWQWAEVAIEVAESFG